MPPSKRQTRRSASSCKVDNDDDAASDPKPAEVAESTKGASPKKRKTASKVKMETKASPKKKAKKSDEKEEGAGEETSFGAKPKRKAAKKTSPKTKKKATAKKGGSSSNDETSKPKPKKAKKADHQRLTERDPLPKLWDADAALEKDGSYTFRVMSWNVAGLRAVMKNHPTALADLATEHGLDVICLQETKLQEAHVDDPKLKINGHLLNEEGYDSYYSCATAKKGYAGTAVFVKRRSTSAEGGNNKGKGGGKKQATLGSYFRGEGKEEKQSGAGSGSSNSIGVVDVKNLIPLDVTYGLGKPEHDAEGRSITLDFPLFTLSNLYVPNSGQKLDRLSYRTSKWDDDLLTYMQRKERDRGLPVIWLGDLNVAHTAMETWNEGAKHLAKSAGTTPEERASFQRQLDAGFADAFRHLHPEAKGQYTYWSQRVGNREPNKGLRLDYFVCSRGLMDDGGKDSKVVVRDSYMIYDQKGSDHCPIVLELEIKK